MPRKLKHQFGFETRPSKHWLRRQNELEEERRQEREQQIEQQREQAIMRQRMNEYQFYINNLRELYNQNASLFEFIVHHHTYIDAWLPYINNTRNTVQFVSELLTEVDKSDMDIDHRDAAIYMLDEMMRKVIEFRSNRNR